MCRCMKLGQFGVSWASLQAQQTEYVRPLALQMLHTSWALCPGLKQQCHTGNNRNHSPGHKVGSTSALQVDWQCWQDCAHLLNLLTAACAAGWSAGSSFTVSHTLALLTTALRALTVPPPRSRTPVALSLPSSTICSTWLFSSSRPPRFSTPLQANSNTQQASSPDNSPHFEQGLRLASR